MSSEKEHTRRLPQPENPESSGKIRPITGSKEGDRKSRFSDRQVKLLETIFESETKIEPLKKVQLAKELGLEPRQVSTWFQNRRARWKSKQLEKEYRILKASYETLVSQVESLKQEKHSLHSQLQNLRLAIQKVVGESENGEANCKNVLGNSLSLNELADSSQASTEKEWCTINANYGFDQPFCDAQWWEFWSG